MAQWLQHAEVHANRLPAAKLLHSVRHHSKHTASTPGCNCVTQCSVVSSAGSSTHRRADASGPLSCVLQAASLGELQQALRVGFAPERLVFDSPAKTLPELK